MASRRPIVPENAAGYIQIAKERQPAAGREIVITDNGRTVTVDNWDTDILGPFPTPGEAAGAVTRFEKEASDRQIDVLARLRALEARLDVAGIP